MRPACGHFAAAFFIFSVCEVELSHMGNNKGNPNIVCEKSFSYLIIYHIYWRVFFLFSRYHWLSAVCFFVLDKQLVEKQRAGSFTYFVLDLYKIRSHNLNSSMLTCSI